jgi:carbonic anhydrase/acetyltransferase-like protein (isoleucine patch superfamily)
VGHSVTLHGCTVEDDALIGIGATILNGARIGKGSVVAAGSLVPENMQVPPATLVMGVPAKPRRAVSAEEQARFAEGVEHYVEKAQTYKEES